MKRILVATAAIAALALPAAAAAGTPGAGKTWQNVTGCTYGDIVRLVNATPGHPSINGLGASRGLDAALAAVAAGHPVPSCS